MTLGYLIARKLTEPPVERKYRLRVSAADDHTLTLPATASTLLPGEWGVFSRSGLTRVHGAPHRNGQQVTWRLVPGSPPVAPGTRVSWSGITATSPATACLSSVDHLFRGPSGDIPAWFVGARPGDDQEVWAVHVHGLGSTRAGTLRGVAAASAAGLPSVVPAYRNTLEGPKVGSGRHTLGLTETADVEHVLTQLSVTGRERFVLFGWSMGAQIVLRLADSERWSARVDRLVLDSPVLDWRRALASNVSHARLPAAAARLSESWLESPAKARRLGLATAVDLDELDWVSRAESVTRPVLIHHGTNDWSVPLEGSEAFARRAPNARLNVTSGGHTTSWNVDPPSWHEQTASFIAPSAARETSAAWVCDIHARKTRG